MQNAIATPLTYTVYRYLDGEVIGTATMPDDKDCVNITLWCEHTLPLSRLSGLVLLDEYADLPADEEVYVEC